jgi:perosamine synthetase
MIYGSFPYFSEESLNQIANEIKSVLKSGRLTDGPQTAEFEKEFANYCGAKYAVATNSGSGSLDIALRHFNLKGREVIVPTNTFISTPNAVIFAGGKPVFADMNPQTLGIDVEDVKRKVTAQTAGVMVVHIAGLVCPQIKELQEFCQEKGLFLVEDCAHAHGATLDGQKAGTFGDVGCFSFYPTKVMTSCEGGMVISNNPEIDGDARIVRTCGQNAERQMVMLGHNWRLNEVVAVIGRNQLAHLEEFLLKRNEVAEWYKEALADIDGVTLYNVPGNSRCSFYKYPTFLAESLNRQKIATALKDDFDVETGHVYYPPCHLHPYYMTTYGTKMGDYPTAERVLNQVLCLPMHVAIKKENVAYIRDSLVSAIKASIV